MTISGSSGTTSPSYRHNVSFPFTLPFIRESSAVDNGR